MKFSFNNPKVKTPLILLVLLSCIIGVVGAFFKIQPVYYAGMGCMGLMLVLTVVAFINAMKEDKEEEKREKELDQTEEDGNSDI